MTLYQVTDGDGFVVQTFETRDDAIDDERRAWKWARANQGFDGDFSAWQSLSYRERMEYEAGAAGEATA